MNTKKFSTIILTFFFFFPLFSTQAWDLGQCKRRCRDELKNPEATGRRVSFKMCSCYIKENFVKRVVRLNPFDPPELGSEVCGVDGRTYKTAEEANLQNVKVLHIGACGHCSNEHDINIYRQTAQNLTETTTVCAKKYILLGEKSASQCMSRVQLTPQCTQCWVDNMGCTATHCLSTCLKARLKGTPNNVNGKLNDCLQCDENYCGKPFIICAGANRRRAGILSDIIRPTQTVWHKGMQCQN